MDFVTDDMIDAFTVGGPPEVWIDRLNRIAALGVEHINVFLLGPDRATMGERLVRGRVSAYRKGLTCRGPSSMGSPSTTTNGAPAIRCSC